jgi:hypothetical protein
VAASRPAIQPAVEPNSPRAAHQAAGTASVAKISESACVPSSERPANPIQPCSST